MRNSSSYPRQRTGPALAHRSVVSTPFVLLLLERCFSFHCITLSTKPGSASPSSKTVNLSMYLINALPNWAAIESFSCVKARIVDAIEKGERGEIECNITRNLFYPPSPPWQYKLVVPARPYRGIVRWVVAIIGAGCYAQCPNTFSRPTITTLFCVCFFNILKWDIHWFLQ